MRPAQRRRALAEARLYLVCGPELSTAELRAVCEAGVDVLQLRWKEAEAGELLREGERFRAVAEEAGVLFLVNDRPDVAYALGADGVHLGQGDLPPRFARELLGPDAIIGRSTHSPQQVLAAADEHRLGLADYAAVGPVFETPTKPGRPAVGLELVRFAAGHLHFPWFAIGGIDPGTVGEVVEAGARRVVVVRAITQASDRPAAARALRAALSVATVA